MSCRLNERPCQTCGTVARRWGQWRHCFPCFVSQQIIRGRAHAAVLKAIQRGELAPAFTRPCVDCGSGAQCYDHRDYTKPLDVSPVCRSCNYRRGSAIQLRPGARMAVLPDPKPNEARA